MRLKKKNVWACSILVLAALFTQQLSAAPKHRDAHVRETLVRVLSAEKYRYDGTIIDSRAEEKSVIERILEKIDGWIEPLKKYMKSLFMATSAFAIAVYAVIFILIVAGIVLLLRRMGPAIKTSKSFQKEIEYGSLDYEKEFARSHALAREGHFREAIQSCIKALWLFYNFKGEIHYRKNITNREYLAVLRQRQETKTLEEIIMRGENAIYGLEESAHDACERIHHQALEILSQ